MPVRTLLDEFSNPSAAFRGKPFWSWNGRLQKGELIRQVHVMKQMGFGGYFMHSRTGLETEYLGEEWFDLINACADEGERLGMESWLYDEDRWPSGTAGGMVTKDPAYRSKYLRCDRLAPGDFAWGDGVLAAFEATTSDMALHEYHRLAEGEAPARASATTVLVFSVEEMLPESFYNGYTYLNTLKKEGTEKFIELTHEKYKAHCGARLGTSIKGIFTDEPHRGSLFSSFGVQNRDPNWLVPYTDDLFEEYAARFGEELVPRLPELFFHPGGERLSPVKWRFVELLQQLFIERWAVPCDEWCRANNLVLTGHILHEDSLTCQTVMSGSMMRYYEHMEWPGIDILTEHNRAYWAAKQLQSVARQVGRPWLLSELYGCTGWQMPFAGHKHVGDWQALFGINVRCHHLSWVTMEGEAKRDYPASILHQSAWWKDYDYVEGYFGRLGAVLSAGERLCDVLVVNPVESVWAQAGPEAFHGLGAATPELQELERNYAQVFHALAGAQLDFDYGDEDLLRRMGSVSGTELRVGLAAYKAVVVSGVETLRATTLALLEEFAAAGGAVVFAGPPPTHVDASPSDAPKTLARNAVRVNGPGPELARAVEKAAGRRVAVLSDAEGETTDNVFVTLRADGDDVFAVLLNTHRERGIANAVVRIAGSGALEEWRPSTGERFSVPAAGRDSFVEVATSFEPGGERVFRLAPQTDPKLRKAPEYRETGSIEVTGPFNYELDEPNCCVLDYAEYAIDDGEWQAAREILKVDQCVRRQFGKAERGGTMLQPWYTKLQGRERLCRLRLRFSFAIEDMPTGPVELAIERPDRWSASVNGTPLPLGQENPEMWVDACFRRFEIPVGALRNGLNSIEIETDFDEGSDLECLYLLGRFGVRLQAGRARASLTRLPEKLAVGDVVPQGLPFYSGRITYDLGAPLDRAGLASGQAAFAQVPDFGAACLNVCWDERKTTIGWRPFEAFLAGAKPDTQLKLETVLTRRNTFGPLHQLPKAAPGYGPPNFVTTGEHWTDDYQLYEAGLLGPVRVVIKEELE